MDIIKQWLVPNKYSRPMTKRKLTTKIAVHYIGNPGTSAQANRNYFNNLATTKKAYASSHYIVGLEGEIVQCVPEDEIAYTTNAANSYSIGIEVCHPKSDGVFSEITRKSLVWLVADLCKRYKLNPLKDIIRHYDVTGKSCPLAWASNSGEKYDDFVAFKYEVKEIMGQYVVDQATISLFGEHRLVDVINIDGFNYVKLRDLECERLNIGWENSVVLLNGMPFIPDGVVHEGRNYVKIRSLESVGVNVGWDEKQRIVILS